MRSDTVIAIVGLGYVGLPLAVEFGKKYRTIGYDCDGSKVERFLRKYDPTGEVSQTDFCEAEFLEFTTDAVSLGDANFVIVAVPTPVDEARIPDLSILVDASITVGSHMREGATVIYESTVYPGATEEICVPLLEKHSKLSWKKSFNVGYSPERVNPGDRERTINKIVKVVSGDNATTLRVVADLYNSVIDAGVYMASSIKVAEAAKVIENTQRDLNIALMNELSIIFRKMGIDTLEVLEAAGTKWNFLPFRPGLVGGHCIGVDPYYLTYKAQVLGHFPEVILAGRRINDGMADYVAQQIIKELIKSGSSVRGANVTVLGLTFKENCPDLRNSKVASLISQLRDYGSAVTVHDPIAESSEAQEKYNISLTDWDSLPLADVVVLAVPHSEYLDMGHTGILKKLSSGGLFVDVKSVFDASKIISEGYGVWRL